MTDCISVVTTRISFSFAPRPQKGSATETSWGTSVTQIPFLPLNEILAMPVAVIFGNRKLDSLSYHITLFARFYV